MKKWIIVVCSLVFILLVVIYFFIPDKIVVARTIDANANPNATYRSLANLAEWQKWWPGSFSINSRKDTVFESGGYQFKKPVLGYNKLSIIVEKGKNADSSFLHLFSPGNDSLHIEWSAVVHTGSNPFSKIRQYLHAREMGKTFGNVLTAMANHINDVKNLYGLMIKKEKVKTQFLVAMTNSFERYPGTADIYEMIKKIRTHISQEKAKEEDFPMLHIKVHDSARFEAQVAIPVDKSLAETATFSVKRMLKNGNILVTEVTGGNAKTDQAMTQLELYLSDHKYYPVALPFYMLVTDRMNKPDSSQWVTRIYYPIL